MKVVDLNLLLYAINPSGPHHGPAREWLEAALSGEEPIALAWSVILGFLRISTNPRLFPRPLAVEEALDVVDGWLARPVVRTLEPGRDHWRRLRELLAETGAAGNLTTDVHLAALAMENGAELVSTDSDFGRFARLRWSNPLRD